MLEMHGKFIFGNINHRIGVALKYNDSIMIKQKTLSDALLNDCPEK